MTGSCLGSNTEVLTQHAAGATPPSKLMADDAGPWRGSAFLDSFFQEKNIRWMLVVGAGIVLGSSLMLVLDHWQSWPAAAKYLTVLAYTGALFFAAQVFQKKLGLKTTSLVLNLLSVLMMPVCFMALRSLSSGSAAQSGLLLFETLALMIPAVVMAWGIGARVFDGLLHRRQTTFLISYVLLCLCGVLPKAAEISARLDLSASFANGIAVVMTLGFWAVMTVGSVKVNRHVFWLMEENRWPRVFGFFPIALLAMQFVILTATRTFDAVPVQWLGFGLVLTGATVLQTSRTVAEVFRQRTGNLIRPLPSHISIPLFVGLMLAAAGVGFSFWGFRYVGLTTFAVVPACLVAAVIMAFAAKDTQHRGFVWASLICLTIAYQCAPTLFSGVVHQIRQSAAAAINEQRLPLAFYGVTYLPLIAGLSIFARKAHQADNHRLCDPIKQFVTIIVTLCFVAAATNLKAAFLVSLINIPVFAALSVMYRDRRYITGTLVALVAVAATFVPFANALPLFLFTGSEHVLTSLIALSLLLVATDLPDRLIRRIPVVADRRNLLFVNKDGSNRPVVRLTGFCLASVSALIWVLQAVDDIATVWAPREFLQMGLLLAVFVRYACQTRSYVSGLSVWLLSLVGAVCYCTGFSISFSELADITSVGAAIVSLGCLCVLRFNGHLFAEKCVLDKDFATAEPSASSVNAGEVQQTNRSIIASVTTAFCCDGSVGKNGDQARLAAVFVVPLCDLSLIVLSGLVATYHAFSLARCNIALGEMPMAASSVVALLWLFAAGYLLRSRPFFVIGATALPLVATGVFNSFQPGVLSYASLPLVWSVVAACVTGLGRWTRTVELKVAESIGEAWLNAIVVVGLFFFAWPIRVASLIALLVLWFADYRRATPAAKTWRSIAANLQLLMLAATVAGMTGFVPFAWQHPALPVALSYLLPLVGISTWVFDRADNRLDLQAAAEWSGVLRAISAVAIISSFVNYNVSESAATAMISGFAVCLVTELMAAVRRQKECHVWAALGVVGVAAAWLFRVGYVQFGTGVSQYVLLLLSMLLLVVVYYSKESGKLQILTRPFRVVGLAMPVVVVAIAVLRQSPWASEPMSAANSLALFLSAAIYMHQWMLTKNKAFAVAAGTILNLSLLLLWRSMQLTDPQFYMVPVGLSLLGLVELLKAELPINSHDPLRYAGSLTILVSPVFNILSGSWLHILMLLVLCVVVILLSIGLKLRALVYTGTAFLAADLVAMVVKGSVDNPAMLWVTGLATGIAVISLAAFCENHKEKLLQNIRFMSAQLAAWK